MTRMEALADAAAAIQRDIDGYSKELKAINQKIHENPELGYEEYIAHESIVCLLRSLGFSVTSHAFGVATSFCAEFGRGGRVVAFNAEYDALPEIGHACGHNLYQMYLPGRVRLIGNPAEEGGGGKLKLIDAGVYDDVHACLMVHPLPGDKKTGAGGQAYWTSLASHNFSVIYQGKPAHATLAPWEGINALDAVVQAYNGIGALRQQMKPYERIHGVISDGGKIPNAIPSSGRLEYYIYSATIKEADELKSWAIRCFEGVATAIGCKVKYERLNSYTNLRPNRTICELYSTAMKSMGSPVTNNLTITTQESAPQTWVRPIPFLL